MEGVDVRDASVAGDVSGGAAAAPRRGGGRGRGSLESQERREADAEARRLFRLHAGERQALTCAAFETLLLDTDGNGATAMRDRRVWHEMTLPISKYHIYSSHNTYLDGHQRVGRAGDVPRVLCRAAAASTRLLGPRPRLQPRPHRHSRMDDVWRVPALDVAEAIRDAYAALPEEQRTPLVISLEMHCKLEGQQRLAQIFSDTFGEMLERPPRDGRLGSPAELMGKILLKGKTCGHRGSVNQTSSQRCTSSRATDASGNFADVDLRRPATLKDRCRCRRRRPEGRSASPRRRWLAQLAAGKSSEQGEDRKSAGRANGIDVGYAGCGASLLLPSSSTLPDGVGDIGSCKRRS